MFFLCRYCFKNNGLQVTLFLLDTNTYTGTLVNNEDLDEMPLKAAFHKSMHCLLRQNNNFQERNATFYKTFERQPL